MWNLYGIKRDVNTITQLDSNITSFRHNYTVTIGITLIETRHLYSLNIVLLLVVLNYNYFK